MDNQTRLKEALAKAFGEIGIEIAPESIPLVESKEKAHGDYASPIAMKKAKEAKRNPVELANDIASRLPADLVEHCEVAGPGFINFFLKKEDLESVVRKIFEEGPRFGDGAKKNRKIDVEFVSANPTGDLHLGHTRGAALGDATASLLQKAGYDVTREYYVNDCGNQVRHLGLSLYARYKELFGYPLELGDDDYHGEDLIAIAQEIKDQKGDSLLAGTDEDLAFFSRYGVDRELSKIKKDLSDFGVHFDVFTYESDIRKSGKIEEAIAFFKEKGLAYEQDGALFLKTSAYLDDKDRPIVKKDGTYTYFMPDIAYHYDKLSRGFDLLVDMLGADHHGYLARMKSALMMKGYPENVLEFGLYQIVRVYKNGEEVKMSKRTGKAVAHRDLVAEVGVDAVRYFFTERSGDTHLDFNLDLALSKSKENPVYYSQYAYARCHSVLTLAEPLEPRLTAGTLVLPLEGEILKQLASFPAMIESAGEARAPHKVAGYVYRLASLVHEYYASTRIIDREKETLTCSRLALLKASSIVIKEALRIIGVSAPEKM